MISNKNKKKIENLFKPIVMFFGINLLAQALSGVKGGDGEPPPDGFTVTLATQNPTIKLGETVIFYGQAKKNGNPVTGEWVELVDNADNSNMNIGQYTNSQGGFSFGWTPTAHYVGQSSMKAHLMYMAGYFSNPITITVNQ